MEGGGAESSEAQRTEGRGGGEEGGEDWSPERQRGEEKRERNPERLWRWLVDKGRGTGGPLAVKLPREPLLTDMVETKSACPSALTNISPESG